jgi:hypothetical protein
MNANVWCDLFNSEEKQQIPSSIQTVTECTIFFLKLRKDGAFWDVKEMWHISVVPTFVTILNN